MALDRDGGRFQHMGLIPPRRTRRASFMTEAMSFWTVSFEAD